MTYSLIFCSRQKSIPRKLEKNIEKTISANYELIVVDNSRNELSIFEAYNIGIDRSSGDYLVFLHDDILFLTTGWGAIIKKAFITNKELGLLGVAGSTIKGKMPSTWWSGPGRNHIRIFQHEQTNSTTLDREEGFEGESLKEVAVIDGVFMAMKKDHRIRFDQSFEGFHNYDLSLCLAHQSLNKKIAVTREILIEHFSEGIINKDWYISASRFHKINYNKLPIIKSEVSEEKLNNFDYTNGAKFVIGLLDHDMTKDALYWWIKLLKIKLMAKFHFKVIISLIKKISVQ